MSAVKSVGIVSLSGGVPGESFVRHALEPGVRRLEARGKREIWPILLTN